MQEAQRKLIEKGLEEDMLCAYVNNNMRCYNESTEFADIMEDSLEAAYKVQQPLKFRRPEKPTVTNAHCRKHNSLLLA